MNDRDREDRCRAALAAMGYTLHPSYWGFPGSPNPWERSAYVVRDGRGSTVQEFGSLDALEEWTAQNK